MAAAPDSGVTGSELFDAVSPELVLVDSDLATRARALLLNPDDTLALPASTPSDPDATLTLPLPLPASILPDYDATRPTQSKPRKPRVFPVSFPDNGSFLETGAASDALGTKEAALHANASSVCKRICDRVALLIGLVPN